MAAPKGNDYNVKWKTKQDRQDACQKLYEHLSQGLSKECFPYADWDTVERYMRDFPEDFPPDFIKEAERLGQLWWEKAGKQGLFTSKEKGFSQMTWAFNMQNRYKWRLNQDVTSNGQTINITVAPEAEGL